MRDISGVHFIMDGYVSDSSTLAPEALTAVFDELVDLLGMEYLQRPTALQVPLEPSKLDSEEDEGGWSVFAQITTSHIALHGWPMRQAFMMDVFSCKPFDTAAAKDLLWNRLGVTLACDQIIERRGPIL